MTDQPLDDVDAKRPRVGVVLALVYAAFVSLGLPDGMLGTAWPQMRGQFGVQLNENWPALALGTCGGVLSSFLSRTALRRLGVSRVLLLTTLLTAVVLMAQAASPTFAVLAALAFFLGLGNGAIDAGLNSFVASNLSSRHMNWLHAFWGVGMSLGTLIISAAFATGHTWRAAYLLVGLLQLGLALAFVVGLPALPNASSAAQSQARFEKPSSLATLALPAARASMALFFVYCGVESGTGLWIASALHDGRHWSMEGASLMVTLYWSSLTVGRFLVGTISQRTTAFRIVRVASVGIVAGTCIVALSSAFAGRSALAGSMTAIGLLVTGFSASSVFPMLTHDTPRCVGQGHALNLVGFQMASGILGYTLLPIGIGTILRWYSLEWLGTVLAGLAVVLLALLLVRERFAAPDQQALD